MWVLIDPVMGVSYNRNAGLALDIDLTMLLYTELTGFSGSRLSWNAELTGSYLMQNAKLLRLAFDEQRECRV